MDDADLFNARHEEYDEEEEQEIGYGGIDLDYDDYLCHLQREKELDDYLWG